MKKRHQLVLAVASASLLLAGCGGSDSATKDTSDSSAVGTKADTSLTEANFVTTITAAQQKAKSSHVSMNIGAAGQKITAEGDVQVGATAADTKAAMTMNLGSVGVGKLEMRLIDSAFFINLGSMSDNKFAKIDLTDSSNPIAKQYGGMLDQLDPSKQLDQFKSALTGLEKKGDAVTLDGVKAQPYVLTLDTSKIKGLESLGAAAAGQIPKSLSYTMFVGPDNLPRRLVTSAAGTDVTLDYSKWGESVDIKAPAKDQITDSSILSKLGGAPS